MHRSVTFLLLLSNQSSSRDGGLGARNLIEGRKKLLKATVGGARLGVGPPRIHPGLQVYVHTLKLSGPGCETPTLELALQLHTTSRLATTRPTRDWSTIPHFTADHGFGFHDSQVGIKGWSQLQLGRGRELGTSRKLFGSFRQGACWTMATRPRPPMVCESRRQERRSERDRR